MVRTISKSYPFKSCGDTDTETLLQSQLMITLSALRCEFFQKKKHCGKVIPFGQVHPGSKVSNEKRRKKPSILAEVVEAAGPVAGK